MRAAHPRQAIQVFGDFVSQRDARKKRPSAHDASQGQPDPDNLMNLLSDARQLAERRSSK